jgi:hypothetical protein
VRYPLRKIAELTGRDPRNITDLLELIAASRVIATTPHNGSAQPLMRPDQQFPVPASPAPLDE